MTWVTAGTLLASEMTSRQCDFAGQLSAKKQLYTTLKYPEKHIFTTNSLNVNAVKPKMKFQIREHS